MKVVWKSRPHELMHRASIDPPIKREGMWNDGMVDGHIVDIGYVIATSVGWKIVFYGTVCRGKHPIESTTFEDLPTAKDMLEKYGVSMIVARYLSPV
jgi:hypothetical protein